MKKLLLASCAAVVGTGTAVAAPPPPPPPVFSWTGCYIGGHAGGGWGTKRYRDTTASVVANVDGPLIGGKLGCDYQGANNWLIGIQGAGSWANIRGKSDPFFEGKSVFNSTTRALFSTTGRLGYASGQWLFYVDGGAAWAFDNYFIPSSFEGIPEGFSGSETRGGLTVGAGVAWAISRLWSVRVDYSYYDFDTRQVVFTPTTANGGVFPARIGQRIQTVTFGVDYHFWTPPHP